MRCNIFSTVLAAGLFVRSGQWYVALHQRSFLPLLGEIQDANGRILQEAAVVTIMAGLDNSTITPATVNGASSRLTSIVSHHTATNETRQTEPSKKDTKPRQQQNSSPPTVAHNITTKITTKITSSSPKENQDVPQTENVVVAMISLGNATQQNHVQRCVRSIRARGEWKGRIVIVTDQPQAYHELTEKDPLITCIHPHRKDWEDLPRYKEIKLKYKRFKTLLIDYITEYGNGDNSSNSDASSALATSDSNPFTDITHILYLDVDIVVCKPLLPWIQWRWKEGAEKRKQLPSKMSTVYMFKEGPNTGKVAHGGLILQDVKLSKGCMEEWRRRMDERRSGRDQALIRDMMRKGSEKTGCKIRAWERKELIFPFPEDFKKMRMKQFVHITNTHHAKLTDGDLQKKFLEEALLLTPEERRDPNSLAIVPAGF